MKNILKYLLPCILMSVSPFARAQNTELLERMYDDFSSKFTTLDISYVIEMYSTDLQGEGIVSFQDNAYRLSADGLEVYCDGRDIWMLDYNAKEVIIEPLNDSDADFIRNPATLFLGLKDNFKVADISEGSHSRGDGVKDIVYTLVPEVECGIDECQIQIKKNGDLYYGSFLMLDRQTDIVRVLVRSITRSPKKDLSYFRPKQSFDSSWIVTDLR